MKIFGATKNPDKNVTGLFAHLRCPTYQNLEKAVAAAEDIAVFMQKENKSIQDAYRHLFLTHQLLRGVKYLDEKWQEFTKYYNPLAKEAHLEPCTKTNPAHSEINRGIQMNLKKANEIIAPLQAAFPRQVLEYIVPNQYFF